MIDPYASTTHRAVDPAAAAARELADDGHHVHLVDDGTATCLTSDCTPPLLIGTGR
ncbi:hypothetical protein [Streptomyces sp. t39]|uniref:hypothetical protein n=1 Tax=Streptomyces sp. t39 TaxID=1828156 RepID=UPI0016506D2F|nr:hypothetical protein [Streptomyces sp. t39]